jgi:hypothetical protein
MQIKLTAEKLRNILDVLETKKGRDINVSDTVVIELIEENEAPYCSDKVKVSALSLYSDMPNILIGR